MSKNYTGLSALYDKLSQACKEVYEGNEFIDPSCGYEINDRGVFKLLEDGKITVEFSNIKARIGEDEYILSGKIRE